MDRLIRLLGLGALALLGAVVLAACADTDDEATTTATTTGPRRPAPPVQPTIWSRSTGSPFSPPVSTFARATP